MGINLRVIVTHVYVECKMTNRKTSAWLARQKKDKYVQAARKEGYRSRASYKLLELQNKYDFLKPGMKVVDLGAAPGGWSQVVIKIIGEKGCLWALDILPIEPIYNVEIIQGDFTTQEVHDELASSLGKEALDWVISDIAPNMSGCSAVDQPKSMGLLENVWYFAKQHLKSNGGLLFKAFQGEGLDQFINDLKKHFKSVVIRKPDSSRPKSKEIYVLARGYNI